jgi:hypothetical protein
MRQVLFIILVLISVIPKAIADASTPAMTIKIIQTGWHNDAVYVNTNEEKIVEGCHSARLILDIRSSMFDQDFALLMSAYHAKSHVVFRVSGCAGNDMRIIGVALVD